ncbi:MAG: ferric reductase-like transmembrane domain-containing protein [Beijerinckiaceae bacterium]
MTATQPNPLFERWSLLAVLSAGIVAISAATLLWEPRAVEGAVLVIRVTAWTSAVLFMLAFTASAMVTLRPGKPSALWQRRNRRYLGLAFAFSHLVHAIAIVAYAQMAPELFWPTRTPLNNTIGGLGYVVITLMALTSFDATTRFVGPRVWKLIHGVGIWVIWVDFVLAFGSRIPMNSVRILPVTLLFLALAIRIAAARKKSAAAKQAIVGT